jgi:hypothetical protein
MELEDDAIEIQEMAENIVGGTTFNGYKLSILEISQWAWENQVGWLTEEYVAAYEEVLIEVADMGIRARSSYLKDWVREKLARAETEPILVIENVTPERFMEYLESLRNQRTGARLSKSMYGNKRAALHHLFRCHEGLDGYPDGFEDRLSNLMRGFARVLTTREQDDGGDASEEGKVAMSVDLYLALCAWFLQEGTMEGIWCHCFLVLTWNLMCRVNNTTRICLNHITWYQDCVRILFRQQKGDQLGLTARYPRHLYANPSNPLASPVFALGLYFSTFGVPLEATSKLFPGRNQYKRFGRLLKAMLEEHIDEVRAFGFEISDIGTHSIRKGATTYLSSQPGGPPPAAICIRAGWTLGGVKDVYIKYEQSGDMFCGRCLSLMNLLQPQFGAAPPSFQHGGLTLARLQTITEAIYPALSNTGLCGAMTQFALASLVFHRNEIERWPGDHYIRMNCQLFRSAELLAELTPAVRVRYPWDAGTVDDPPPIGTGIPPHVAILQELRTIGETSNRFIADFSARVHTILDERAVEVGGMSAQALALAIRDGTSDIRNQMEAMALGAGLGLGGAPPGQGGPVVPPQARHRWRLHVCGGAFHVLPQQWRFPSCTPLQAWTQWLLGDTVNEVPPLKMLTGLDVAHLDALPLAAGTRRPRLARKVLSDLRFLMNVVERMVRLNGNWTEEHTLESVNAMFQIVANHFVLEGGVAARHIRRGEHLKWQTFIPSFRLLHHQ